MTARGKRCVCRHARGGHRDHRHECSAFLCPCTAFVARGDNERILEMLEEVDR